MHDFGEALMALRSGCRVYRFGWNGKGMWIKLIEPGGYIGRMTFDDRYKDEDGSYPMLPWIGMKTVDGQFVPWLASHTDILATDWQLVAL